MKSTLLLKVVCRDATTARALVSVLAPDNRVLPSDQRISVNLRSRSAVFRVESKRARSGLTTICSVLRDITLFREIWLISRASGG